jgi:arylsulfatase A-like enzyme/tetratricopeptide (TPR) repeat protein
LAAVIAVVAAGCRAGVSTNLTTTSNVVLVTVDTLRADHLTPYGDTAIDTPAASRLAREGIRFSAAYTPVPLTLPAHTSILTGLLPFSHGVRDNGGFYLDPAHQTLATIFKAHGFQTAAFVSAFVLDSRWGLANGFDEYWDHFAVSAADLNAMARVQRPGGETWQEARRWLDGHINQRFFVWLHLFDPHTPYTPPEPYRSRYLKNPYDGEVTYADSIVGQLVSYLEQHQLLDHTIVVLVGDHGEGLGEHGEDEHGLLLYDSTLHVPWIMRLPGGARAGTVIDRAVSLVDVAPTLLGLLRIPAMNPADGVDLAPLLERGPPPPERPLYAETFFPRLHFNWSELVSIRDDRYKLIRAPRQELFDYRVDPAESHNLMAARASIVSALDRTLAQLVAHTSAPIAGGVDPDSARRLGSLGYIGATAAGAPRSSGAAVDPKDRVTIYRSLTRAREQLTNGNARDGIAALEDVVRSDPDLEPARRLLREYWLEQHQTKTGLSWFRSASARQRDASGLLVELGRFQEAAGHPSDALRTFEAALTKQPNSIEALTATGELVRRLGQNDRALALFRQAADETNDAPPRIRVAETLLNMGRLSEADRVLSDVLAANPKASGAHYLQAQIAEQQHDLPRAEREYRLEMTVSSWDYRAAFNLAALVGARNDHTEQVALLESIPPIAPNFPDVYFYLAKALLDLGDPARRSDAIAAANRGLQLAPDSSSAPLGHYVLADIYQLQGRPTEAERELQAGQALERRVAGNRSD